MIFKPQEGVRAVHQSRGAGTITKINDHQYCYFKPDGDDDTHFVCMDNLSKLVCTN
jgi:hypothetical protein